MRSITKKSPLWLVAGLVLVVAMSCANDKTFEGKWEKTEKVDNKTFMIEFKSDKTGTLFLDGSSAANLTWKANFTKKTLEIVTVLDGTTYSVKADYKFTKNFKKLKLSNVEVSGGISSNNAEVKDIMEGDYDKQ